MSVSVQESLLDMGGDGPVLGALEGSVRRTPLAHGAWVDFCPGGLAGSGRGVGAVVLPPGGEARTAHAGPELGEPFLTAGLCLYRDGRDSVAWHGDTIGRGQTEDTMVAIVSLGSPRPE